MITVPGIPTLLLSQDEWAQEQYLILEDSHSTMECLDCDGSGEDECGCCGSLMICATCDGDGEVECEKLPEHFKRRSTTWERYVEAVTDEVKQLCRYIGLDFAPLSDELPQLLKENQRHG